jgi:predicted nucleotidyltransferase
MNTSLNISDKIEPEHDIVMSVAGFEDAYHCSTKIQISTQPNVEIRVPTIPGMAIMKLLSWEDAFPDRPKDALDLYFLLLHYKDADIVERIFVENKKIFDECDQGFVFAPKPGFQNTPHLSLGVPIHFDTKKNDQEALYTD